MKTQRLDAEFRRLEQEQERRQLQRNLHYDNKKSTHQKLYSRVLAKNFLEGIESMAFKVLADQSRRC
jgi:hypothetical protein